MLPDKYWLRFVMTLSVMSFNLSTSARAGAWALPRGEAEIIAKQTYTRDISPTPFREKRYNQREIYGQFGLGYNAMLSFTTLTARSAQLGPHPTGSKQEFEIVYAPSRARLSLFPPGLTTLISKLRRKPIQRYKSTSVGLGYSFLKLNGEPTDQEFLRTSLSVGDKLQIGNIGLLGHVTWADYTNNRDRITDARAMLAVETAKYGLGYEFGYFEQKNREAVLEDLIFLEIALPWQQAKLRFTRANKTIALTRFNARTYGIWLRIPFQTSTVQKGL